MTTRTSLHTSFSKANETFPRFIVILSQEEKAVTSLSPFVIEKQIESVIGTPKSVKKLKNRTLLVEASRKSQTDSLLKMSTFFGIKVSVTEHKTLNSSKGVIGDRMLKDEKESEIVDYLKEQGVIGCKRFTIKKDNETIETNTLLLTFNSITVPKSLKIFYRIVPVDVYMFQILYGVLTIRGLDITRINVQPTWDLFALTAVQMVIATIPLPARIKLNV